MSWSGWELGMVRETAGVDNRLFDFGVGYRVGLEMTMAGASLDSSSSEFYF